MRGPRIPLTNYVSRLCPPTKCGDDGSPSGAAFMPREGEDYLSVNWLECTGFGQREEQIEAVRYQLKNKGMRLPATGRLAVLHLQSLLRHIQGNDPDGHELSVHHEREADDPCHSGIYGYTHEDALVADLIAQVVEEHYPARG